MKTYASLHTQKPAHASDSEVSYAGYARVAIDDWTPNFGRSSATLIFAPITETADDHARWVAISCHESGVGEILQLVELIPNVPLTEGYQPRVVFANIPEPLPEALHPIAKEFWYLVNDRLVNPDALPPKLFEAINDEFVKHGLKPMQVTRSGTATMIGKMSQMQSLSLTNEVAGHA